MKKILLPLVALMLSMVACQKDNEGILTLKMEKYASDAKVHLSNNYAAWDNNDPVRVNGNDYYVRVSSTTASISGVAEASTYTALYPANWANSDGTTITYPETQTYRTNGTNGSGDQVIDAPMAAYSDGGTLKFHNLGTILAVNVSGMSRVETIKVVADVNINGTCTISNITTDRPSLGAPTSGTNTTILECNGVSVPNDGMTFYIALPPINAKLTITVDDGSIRYTKSQSNAMAFASNNCYGVPFIASTATPEQYAPMPNQIWYTATEGIVNFSDFNDLDDSQCTYDATTKKGVLTFISAITDIPQNAFQGNTSLNSVTLPSSVTSIDNHAFDGCKYLISITLPGVIDIGNYVFEYCFRLTSVDMPNVNWIGTYAFQNCNSLRSITLPASLSEVGRYAFSNCGLNNINCYLESPIDWPYFWGIDPSDKTLHVPSGTASNWTTWWSGGTVVADL